mmetsp:Transcript_4731/g.11486  ORF Transcript_4731/g.11486 Transcript_4731/m.11486 type:complete len:180 (-) Transcript_4731:258-797(-)
MSLTSSLTDATAFIGVSSHIRKLWTLRTPSISAKDLDNLLRLSFLFSGDRRSKAALRLKSGIALRTMIDETTTATALPLDDQPKLSLSSAETSSPVVAKVLAQMCKYAPCRLWFSRRLSGGKKTRPSPLQTEETTDITTTLVFSIAWGSKILSTLSKNTRKATKMSKMPFTNPDKDSKR